MKKSLCALLFLTLGFLTGCASILGNGENVKVNSNPINTAVTVYDGKGTKIETVTTPKTISLKRAGNYTFEFNQTDYMPETISIRKKFNHSYWANFLLAGIGASSYVFFSHFNEFNLAPFNIAGYGLGAIGVIGIFFDIFAGSLVGVTPEETTVNLRLTPEATARKEAQMQEEFARREAQRQAEAEESQKLAEERQKAENARRQARIEANRYDPAKFIIVPDTFSPADYTKADLFDAVAASEKLQAYLEPGTYEWFDIFGVYSRDFVSDVVFVSQNGTDITFRTEDNAISKRMKVDSRTGLTSGQKVRIYYRAYRIRDWRITAIERL
jgi:hypothetical protein